MYTYASGGGGGSADPDMVEGPASATDNAVARFDGTTGKLIQNSAVTVSDLAAASVTVASVAGNALVVDVPEPAAAAGASVAGKPLTLSSSDAVASTDTDGAAAGGAVTIASGAAARRTSGNANGGDINLNPGAGIGSGTRGLLKTTATTIQGGANAEFTAASGTVSLGNSSQACTLSGFWTTNTGTGALSTASGYPIICGIAVRPKTASPVTIVVPESRGIYTNEGAGGAITFNLPGAAAGLDYTFIVQSTNDMVVTAASGDTIRIGASVSGAAGTATNGVIGSSLRIVAINATEWVALSTPNGTWTLSA